MSAGAANPNASGRRVFRLPGLTYLVAVFLLFSVAPLAFAETGAESAGAVYGPRMLLLLIPILAAAFIARTATVVDPSGVVVRALLGSRTLPWDKVRGLSVSGRAVYAVLGAGAVRLPCVRVADLAALSRASGGHLPDVAEAPPKYAPSRRSRRR